MQNLNNSECERVITSLAHLDLLNLTRGASVGEGTEDLGMKVLLVSVLDANLEVSSSDHLGGVVDGLELGEFLSGLRKDI